MSLHNKIIFFIKPYWKHIILVTFLTILFVLLNNLSLWISVDFLTELFEPNNTNQTQTMDAGQKTENSKPFTIIPIGSGSTSIYKDVKSQIKSWLITDSKQKTLVIVCLAILLTFLLKNIVFYSRRILLNLVELRIIYDIRNHLQKKMLLLPIAYFDKRHSGDLNSVVFNDVNAIRTVLNTSFGNLILSPFQILANVIILFLISWHLSLIMFFIVPVSAWVMVKVGQGVRRRSRRVFKQLADVQSLFLESMTGIRIVKAFTSEQREYEKFKASNKQFYHKMFRQLRLKYLTSPINEMLFVAMLTFLLWYGGNLVYSNTGLNAEDFIRFLLFLFTMFQPLKDLSNVNNVLQNGMAAAERIFGVLEENEEKYEAPNAVEMPPFNSAIEYRDVTFAYDQAEGPVLDSINLKVNKGQTVAFVGPSGSGKTTLVNLLSRLYELQQGQILFDEAEYRDFTLQSLRRQIGVVTQDTILFNDTVRFNISYSDEQADEQRIVAAAKAANAWEFIEKLPQGLDTQIGEKGTRLSGGQKQRLSIARAILKNPPILILDEATSALDTESEQLVQEAIVKLLENRTVLVIAHRLSTIQNADKIVVLDNGKIESMGRHQELLESSPTYRNLYEKQFSSASQPTTAGI